MPELGEGHIYLHATCYRLALTSCLFRLPCAALPGQKGSGADHADLVRRPEPLPADCLPGNQQPHPADGRRPHRGLVEVRKGWEEHEGMKR